MVQLALIPTLSMYELIIILAVVLIIFGPKSLPKLARAMGSSIREFKDATTKMSNSIMDEDEEERRSASRSGRPKEVDSDPVERDTGRDTEREKASTSKP